VLKNSFALFSASEAGAENAVFVVFWPWFEPLLDRRPGRYTTFSTAWIVFRTLSSNRAKIDTTTCVGIGRRYWTGAKSMFGKGVGWGSLVRSTVSERSTDRFFGTLPRVAQTAGQEGSLNLTKHAFRVTRGEQKAARQ
jgi:hypothetical protein